jgi:hypothetical protein
MLSGSSAWDGTMYAQIKLVDGNTLNSAISRIESKKVSKFAGKYKFNLD